MEIVVPNIRWNIIILQVNNFIFSPAKEVHTVYIIQTVYEETSPLLNYHPKQAFTQALPFEISKIIHGFKSRSFPWITGNLTETYCWQSVLRDGFSRLHHSGVFRQVFDNTLSRDVNEAEKEDETDQRTEKPHSYLGAETFRGLRLKQIKRKIDQAHKQSKQGKIN